MKRQERLLALLVALQEQQRSTADALARRFEVSERTILRDVATLAAADVPVFAERGRYGGIVLLPGTQIDLARLGPAEVELLHVVGLDLTAARQLGMDGPAGRLVAKAAAVRRRTREVGVASPLALSDVVTVDNRGWFATPSVDVAALAEDLRSGSQLLIRYRSSGSAEASWSTVDPYGLLLRAGRWYLVADRDGHPRLYAVGRLERWEVMGDARRLRDGARLETVARELAGRLDSDHRVIVTAELDADRFDLAERILGTRLLGREPTERAGTVRIRVAYPELGGVRQLLQFAEHIRIIDPPEARKLAHDLATSLAARHH